MALTDGLNEQQQQAITTGLGPVLVLAGPGSGKTRVLTHRIAYLIQQMHVEPHRIMAVTFTNKAAGEMRERVFQLLGGRLDGLQIGTFHSICARILRREADRTPYGRDYVIYDTDDQLTVVKQAFTELNVDTKKLNPRSVLGHISAAKNEMIEAKDYVGTDYFTEIISRVYERYQLILVDNNAMDFDDLLLQMAILLRDNDAVREKYQQLYDFVLVDEFQDTNTVQYRLVQTLGQPRNNVFVVGDEDQGIYAFRGADHRNVLQFREDYPDASVILLEQNYRSTQHILDAARAVIDRNPNRTPKALFTDRGEGEKLEIWELHNEQVEAERIIGAIEELRRDVGYDWSDFAVMYRTNAQSRALEDAFVLNAIPYKLIGGVGYYKRREVRDLLAYLRVVNNLSDKVSFQRIINTPRRGIGKKSLADFHQWATRDCASYDHAFQILIDGGDTALSGRTARSFADFGALLMKWRTLAEQNKLVELFDTIKADIGYISYAAEISERDEQLTERMENIDQLRSMLMESEENDETLIDFLAEKALVADVDDLDETVDSVTLLTLHAAKGLEYPVVFIVGVEESLIPHQRSFDEPEGVQEERRLLYVGITRAEERLFLTHTFRRLMFGSSTTNSPSRFLGDIPPTAIAGISGRVSQQRAENILREMTRWDSSSTAEKSWQPDPEPKPKPAPPSTGNSKLRSKIMRFPGSGKDTQNTKSPTHTIGTKVKHPIFGVGRVVDSRIDRGIEEVDVAFENKEYGIKKSLSVDYLATVD